MQIPIAGRDNAIIELRFLSVFFQSYIGPDIDAMLLSGINFTPSFETSATGTVALLLRALRHRADVGHIDESAVTAVLAVKERDLGQMFQFVKEAFELCPFHFATEPLH